jgi:poly(hydroxyalkanoate) depolymerase family esterase
MRTRSLLVLGIGLLWIAPLNAAFIYDQVLLRDSSRARSDDRRYALYVPSNYDGKKAVPLVVALHGCHQTERMVADKSRLDEVAEREGFIVAYPYIARSDRAGETNDEGGRNPRCWGFWFAEEIHRDRGEVGDIARLADRIGTTHNIDANRIHVIGLSSGGAMTTAALVAYPDKFASGVVLSGVGYAETAGIYTGGIPDCDLVLNANLGTVRPAADVIRDMRAEMGRSVLRQVPILVIHNRQDCTVPFKVNQAIVEHFAGLMAAEGKAIDIAKPVSSMSGTTASIPWMHNKYGVGPAGASLIETLYLDAGYRALQKLETRLTRNEYLPQTRAPNDIDRGHAWFGGKRGPWFLTVGPVSAEVAWAFFKDHPREQAATGRPVVTCGDPVVSGRSVTLGCSATDDGTITGYRVIIAGPTPQDESLPGGPSFNRQYTNLGDGDYSATVTATDDQGNVSSAVGRSFRIGAPAGACVTASNPSHIANGRAHVCGWFFTSACANGSNDDLGFNTIWNISSIRQTDASSWTRTTSCP